METLGYYKADINTIGLSNVEGVLEDAIATVFWRGKYIMMGKYLGLSLTSM